MDTQSMVVLTIQLFTLFSIASALLLYLLWKVKGTNSSPVGRNKTGSILITSVDSALGLQLCTHFANKGCRVFAGMKDSTNSLPAKLLEGWTKMRQNTNHPLPGSIIPLTVDVTREDVLQEAAEILNTYLNVGEHGILAVINTAGCVYRGKFENQDPQQWDSILRTNILGSLRVARVFLKMLLPTRGRFIFLGSGNKSDGLVAYITSRIAIEGCVEALREEFKMFGVDVVSLDTDDVPVERLFQPPTPFSVSDEKGSQMQYSAEVLASNSILAVERALWDQRPHNRYHLEAPNHLFPGKLSCRLSFRKSPKSNHVNSLQCV